MVTGKTEFSEQFYLSKYSDVREAVKAGAFSSGYAHYLAYGKAEGRDGSKEPEYRRPAARSTKAVELTPELAAAAKEQGARFSVSTAIHESDYILAHIINHSQRSKSEGPPGGVAEYFEQGKENALQVEEVIGKLGFETHPAVLEFAAGFGRVTRHLMGLDLTASDIHDQALLFLEAEIGAKTIPSAISPELMPRSPKQFDFIFVLSLFSHLPDKLFGAWLSRLNDMLSPGGFLMFTTHGEAAAKKSKPLADALDQELGFGYLPDSDQLDLSPDIYGSSIATPTYVAEQVRRFTKTHVHSFNSGAWWALQDEWIIQRGE